jgi:putative SOS response-associated peptidase YedK
VDKSVTNIRNVASPHWRRWLGLPSRCLVPFTSFSENDKLPDGRFEPVWFAFDDTLPLAFFAGIWTTWTSTRKLADVLGLDMGACSTPVWVHAAPRLTTRYPSECDRSGGFGRLSRPAR